MSTPKTIDEFETIQVSPKNMRLLRRIAKFNAFDDLDEALTVALESYIDD